MVKWELITRIKQFPMDMAEQCGANYLFSPCLMYYLDFDKNKDIFLIKETITQEVFKIIPKGLMNPKREEVTSLAKRFMWIDKNRIKVINNEGMENVIDIHNNFDELEYGKVYMFENELKEYFLSADKGGLDENAKSAIKSYHYYYNQPRLSYDNTKERLLRNVRQYYTGQFIDQKKAKEDLYSLMFSVDYPNDFVRGSQSEDLMTYQADLSFTYIHWRQIEKIALIKDYDADNLSNEEIQLLCLNILPNCNTLLHKIAHNLKFLRQIFERLSSSEFVIPFIKNMEGLSPVQVCLANRNYKGIEIFLANIQNFPIDSHGRVLIENLSDCVNLKISSVGPYIDSRLLKTN